MERQKFSYTAILKRLATISNEEEAIQLIKEDIEKGELGQKDIGNVVRKWRQAKQRKDCDLPRPDLNELFAYEGTLEELKELITNFVKNGLLHHSTASRIVKKWRFRENRRLKRQMEKKKSRICLRCRNAGHKVSDCPELTNQEGVDICFKCGSTEHAIYKCPRKDKVQGFPYATCFICKQQGHLSKDCEQNDHGIYPDGGCCNICSSKLHLIRDCPQRLASSGQTVGEDEKEKERPALSNVDPFSFVDEDNFEAETRMEEDPITDVKENPRKKPKVKKVVKF